MLYQPGGGARGGAMGGRWVVGLVAIGQPELHLLEGWGYGDDCSITGKASHLDIRI